MHEASSLYLSTTSTEREMKSVAAACTARPQRFFWMEIPFPGRKIVSLQILRPEAEGFK